MHVYCMVTCLMPTLLAWLPVYDSMPVQEHQSGRDLGRVKAGSSLVELPRSLNLKHQVASVNVLHHEEQPVLERERDRKRVTHFAFSVYIQYGGS